MLKKTTILMLMFVLLPTVFGLGTANNQTLTEFQNLTRADNILEMTTEINIWLDGMLGIMIWVASLLVPFMMSLFSTGDARNSLLAAFFIASITSVLLLMTGMASYFIVYASIVGLLVVAGIKAASQ